MKKVTKKVAAPKSKAKIVKKPLRKYDDGGMAGKGPLQPTPKKEKTAEELAKETVARLTTIPKVETPTPKATTPTKKRSDGFASEAQKTAYIKNTKELLKKNSVADLVKMKHGTAAGLAALGFKDEVKKATPVAKATSTPAAPIKKNNEPVSKPQNLGQKQAKVYRDQVVDTKSVYGVTKGDKSIATTVATKRSGDKLVKVTSVNKGSATGEGWKTAYKVIPSRTQVSDKGNLLHINKKGTVITKKDKKTGDIIVEKGKNIKFIPGKELKMSYDKNSLSDKMIKKSPITPAKKQAERTAKLLATGTYPMFKRGGKTVSKKK